MNKYPDSINVTCSKCRLVYAYHRESRTGLTYYLSPDEKSCSCFDPMIDLSGFQKVIKKISIWPRTLKLGRG